MPRITVGITAYNRPEMLRECVASILGQSYQYFDILIGNDYVDGPVTFASLGIPVDPRIRIVNHPQNIGAYNNNYFLLREASGDWFTWLADDDLMHPDFLQIAYEVLSENDVNSVFSNYVAAPDPVGLFPKAIVRRHPEIFDGHEFIDRYTSRRLKVVGSYGVFRREILPDIGGVHRFGTGLAVYVDTFIPIVAASLGRVAYVDLDLVFLRTHAGSASATSNDLDAYLTAQRDYLAEFDKRCRRLAGGSFDQWANDTLIWFATDVWAVICRGRLTALPRLWTFFRYVADILKRHIPQRFATPFLSLVTKLVLVDTLKQSARRVLRRH